MQEIQRMSITDAVVKSIKAMIEVGEYKTDQKLPAENDLCQQLKVSRTSVREALRVLQALGYVKILPGRGAFVDDFEKAKAARANWYDSKEAKFYDYLEVRMAVEVFAIRLSAERASDAQLEEVQQIHESFLAAREQNDLVKLIMLDELFHEKIISCTRNPLLVNINRELTEQYRVYRGDSLTGPLQYYNAVKGHSAILSALRSRDPNACAEAMQEHLTQTLKDLPASKRMPDSTGAQ